MHVHIHVHVHVSTEITVHCTCSLLGEGAEGLTGVPGCLGESPAASRTVGRLPGRDGETVCRSERPMHMYMYVHL